jgi:putative tryptophan/tyrosine transport system substrate-binding protein
MQRRDFITLLGSAAATWPLAASAQEPSGVRRIGVLMNISSDDPEGKNRVAAFVLSLEQLGWVDGRNVQIVTRWSSGDVERVRRQATELVAQLPDVILASGSAAAAPLLQATRAVPIVFVNTPDPVGAGYVKNLARPGGNATGFLLFEYSIGGKWLDLLKQIAPEVNRVAVLRDAAISAGLGQYAAVQSAAASFAWK